jgi:hypothetical protein
MTVGTSRGGKPGICSHVFFLEKNEIEKKRKFMPYQILFPDSTVILKIRILLS